MYVGSTETLICLRGQRGLGVRITGLIKFSGGSNPSISTGSTDTCSELDGKHRLVGTQFDSGQNNGSTERGARNGEHGKFLDRVQQTNPTMSTYQIFIFDYIAVCINLADLAQSVERAPFKRVAVGSIPTVGIISLKLPCYKVSIHTYSERVSSILAAEIEIIIY